MKDPGAKTSATVHVLRATCMLDMCNAVQLLRKGQQVSHIDRICMTMRCHTVYVYAVLDTRALTHYEAIT